MASLRNQDSTSMGNQRGFIEAEFSFGNLAAQYSQNIGNEENSRSITEDRPFSESSSQLNNNETAEVFLKTQDAIRLQSRSSSTVTLVRISREPPIDIETEINQRRI
ncbi:hypothetical protein SteCoe_22768 [Stentor coeruleus]|uniref:Uncharacterized protein n=1 Tax=Stentor coeruleus TaxID=5963 RepID=A0A1R2BLA2_9CILI|nr:hypothetical protein SteCoe_22768 [Stentor coeruleus]